MDRKEYIEKNHRELFRFWYPRAAAMGSVLFLFIGILDYVSFPEHFNRFIIYRGLIATILLVTAFFARKQLNRNFQHQLVYIASLSSAIIIELMVIQLGGYESGYYVGLILLAICVLGFIPVSVSCSIITTVLIYTTYLVPILILQDITNFRTFFMHNFFTVSVLITAVAWRYFSNKNISNEFSLKYDIEQQKEQLKVYSTQLEQLVAERTKELSISEKRYRELFESANDGIVVFDENGIIIDMNKQFCEIHGFDKVSLTGASIKILEPENHIGEKQDRMRRILSGESLMFETEHLRKDGSTILLEVSSKAIDIDGKTYIQSFHRDIAEKKRLQNQLFHSQKMESIGVLAGGLAHDFNNMLTSLLGHTELLLMEEDMNAMSKKRLKTIENSARKAGQMVSQLLGFARKVEFLALPMNLNDALRDAIELVERVMKKKEIEVKKELNDEIPVIKGDSSQLEQVIVNLLMNAGDAIPNSGTITVSTSMRKIERNDNRYPLLKPGTYACLRISDTGTGIPNEIIDRIFDPFFTTKAPGKGTGLGLAMVYGIVREHQGTIDIKSQMGKGTTFEVCLPAYVGHSSV